MRGVSAMITVFSGDNSYEIHQAVQAAVVAFSGEVERYDGVELTASQMADICSGQSLFATKKLVVIRELSQQKQLWASLAEWLKRLADDTQLLLIEPAPDKRTKSYQLLQQIAHIQVFASLSSRDTAAATQWLYKEAQRREIQLEQSAARELVTRLGVDQWTLVNELQRLQAFTPLTVEIVRQYTACSPSENVFTLLETAAHGSPTQLHAMLQTLQATNDPYMTFGLLSSQLLTISAIVVGEGRSLRVIAQDIGQKEYSLRKLQRLANMRRDSLEQLITALAAADTAMKTTDAPWQVIETFLLQWHDCYSGGKKHDTA